MYIFRFSHLKNQPLIEVTLQAPNVVLQESIQCEAQFMIEKKQKLIDIVEEILCMNFFENCWHSTPYLNVMIASL